MRDQEIDRLLRSAAQAPEEQPAMPFAFDTRVIALWNATTPKANGLTWLLRRVALLSAIVIVVSTVAVVREVRQSREKIGEPFTNEFALADSAIQDEF